MPDSPATTAPERTAAESVVVDTGRSPYATLRPVPVGAVRFHDDVWAPRIAQNRRVTLPSQYRQLVETKRLYNFQRVAGTAQGPFVGRYYNDSDVYKWIEAASWALATTEDDELKGMVDEAIEVIGAAQRDDGYLNTYFALERADERWTTPDLHELYCAGHLFQAAVAHYRATGERSLLTIAQRFADHICDRFGPESEGKRPYTDGHEEVELGLIELGRATGEQRYIDQAAFFVEIRGHGHLPLPYNGRHGAEYHQDHVPLREAQTVAGHVVRQLYFTAGATDLYLERGDAALLTALERLWTNMTTRRMYVSGGVGARWAGEAFGDDFELPSERAYTETCAAIASVMWNWRLLAIAGNARYADLMEWTLYNAVLPGLSFDGTEYFYQNPLADGGDHRRQPWFGTACCPPNIARTIAAVGGYMLSTSEDTVWVHLYAASAMHATLPDGREVRLRQECDYPWDGHITIQVETEGDFSLRLRVPGWCETGVPVHVNGDPTGITGQPDTYVEVQRSWQAGDVVSLHLDMPVRRLVAHPLVESARSQVALARGPLLYCVEATDNGGLDPRLMVLPEPSAVVPGPLRRDVLGGIVPLTAQGEVTTTTPWETALYREAPASETTEVEITAIPYYAWANREPGPMTVWLRT